ncbi:IS701 family transposase [Kitasatospora mediocidica]|uniref:IS701 family transposase n=1 Tax=Kitasatospora mediocidica TaxID=58352 RepID=UPI0018DC928B|nr:transposase [Kitasatospora mediocidica]
MVPTCPLGDPAAQTPQDGFDAYCRDLFAQLPRADQRMWGGVYLRGLVYGRGRRTPAAITEQVIGRRAVQSIQQFVNQSSWSSTPVRRHLAERAGRARAPQGWIFTEVPFPKDGRYSAGVGRQFVGSAGRTVHCQLGLAASLAYGEDVLPVNWRLMLPRHWDDDAGLRGQAHVPDQERSRPRWCHVLETLDEMLDWAVPRAPVWADFRHERVLDPLLLGLTGRRLPYLVRVGPTTRLQLMAPPGEQPRCRTLPMAEIARTVLRQASFEAVLRNAPTDGSGRTAHVAVAPIAVGPYTAPQYLVLERPDHPSRPRSLSVTSLTPDRLGEALALGDLGQRSADRYRAMREAYGLGHHEGRSFRGWHHHVTLVSGAAGFHVLRGLEAVGQPEPVGMAVGS